MILGIDFATSFDSLDAFLAMGGHGFYVWLSYALALGVVVYNIVAPLARRRRFLAAQRGRIRRGADPVDANDGQPDPSSH